ncbi:MAG: hypothetical protein GXP29_09130 [Planctomycetes bacterium]|nr:hypothetical protein [Planctomycetota bacterium]
MNTRRRIGTWVIAMAVGLISFGCQQPPPGDLDGLQTDTNNNGFPEIQPPDGVTFEDFGSLNVDVSSDLTQQEAGDLLEAFGLDRSLLDAVTVRFNITLTLNYGNGLTDTLQETKSLEPFSIRFEAACPLSANIEIVTVATVPFLGDQTLSRFDFDLFEDTDYRCGETIEARAVINTAGVPQFEVNAF